MTIRFRFRLTSLPSAAYCTAHISSALGLRQGTLLPSSPYFAAQFRLLPIPYIKRTWSPAGHFAAPPASAVPRGSVRVAAQARPHCGTPGLCRAPWFCARCRPGRAHCGTPGLVQIHWIKITWPNSLDQIKGSKRAAAYFAAALLNFSFVNCNEDVYRRANACTYIHTYTHTDTHSYIHPDRYSDRHTYAYMQPYIQPSIQAGIHTY